MPGLFLCQIKNRGYYENDIGSVGGKGNHLPGRKKIGTNEKKGKPSKVVVIIKLFNK